MKTLLRIDASVRTAESYSRKLADVFQEKWLIANPHGKVVTRDLTVNPVPHLKNETILDFFSPAESHTPEIRNAIALSDTLVAELVAADAIVFSTPLYNFSIPSVLKAYIDHIVRAGKTFGMNEQGFFGMLKGKKAIVLLAKGAVYRDTPLNVLDYCEPYLRALLTFLGIETIETLVIEGTTTDVERAAEMTELAYQHMDRIIECGSPIAEATA